MSRIDDNSYEYEYSSTLLLERDTILDFWMIFDYKNYFATYTFLEYIPQLPDSPLAALLLVCERVLNV